MAQSIILVPLVLVLLVSSALTSTPVPSLVPSLVPGSGSSPSLYCSSTATNGNVRTGLFWNRFVHAETQPTNRLRTQTPEQHVRSNNQAKHGAFDKPLVDFAPDSELDSSSSSSSGGDGGGDGGDGDKLVDLRELVTDLFETIGQSKSFSTSSSSSSQPVSLSHSHSEYANAIGVGVGVGVGAAGQDKYTDTKIDNQHFPQPRWISADTFIKPTEAPKIFQQFAKKLNPIMLELLLKEHLDVGSDSNALKRKLGGQKIKVKHYKLAMRDGVKLSTFVAVPNPKDGTKRPTLLARSPYGPTSDALSLVFTLLNGHVAIIQDQRGTFASEGNFTMWQKDAEDGEDTMNWISKQPWSNGEVFSAGVSADGCGAFTQLLTAPKQLKGQLLIWASADGHETTYPGGAYREGLVTGWMSMMSILTKGHSLTHTLPDILAHETLSDWWRNVEAEEHFPNAHWPTVMIAGWWDIFSGHQLEAFEGLRKHGDPKYRDAHTLVVGPLGHCMLDPKSLHLEMEDAKGMLNGIGYASELFASISSSSSSSSGSSTSHHNEKKKHHSKFMNGSKMKKINFYVQGTGHQYANFWTSLDDWPEITPTKLYLNGEDELLIGSNSGSDNLFELLDEGYGSFLEDPVRPVRTHGGGNLVLAMLGMGCGSMDQSAMEAREDVLKFTSPPLEKPLAMTGRLRAVFHVSSDRNDTDFAVSVNDVHPDGKSMQIRFGLRRMRWRNSTPTQSVFSTMEAGKVYRVDIDLWFTSYVVNPGHRLRVTVTGSNSPYFARTDNSGRAGDVLGLNFFAEKRAENRVHWSPDLPSYVEIPQIELDALERNDLF